MQLAGAQPLRSVGRTANPLVQQRAQSGTARHRGVARRRIRARVAVRARQRAVSTNVRIVIAEGIGTCLLVFLAVGTAVIAVSAKVGVVGASPRDHGHRRSARSRTPDPRTPRRHRPTVRVTDESGRHLGSGEAASDPCRSCGRRMDRTSDRRTGRCLRAVSVRARGHRNRPTPSARVSAAGSDALTLQEVLIAGLLAALLLAGPLLGIARGVAGRSPARAAGQAEKGQEAQEGQGEVVRGQAPGSSESRSSTVSRRSTTDSWPSSAATTAGRGT